MHYYQFNIGDYVTSTQHLEPMEDLAYRRMLDLYYQKELPLPLDKEKIGKLIRMRTHCDCIEFVLSEFFTKEQDGYHNAGADKNLTAVYTKSDKAKRSAEARWAKAKKIKELEECERIANALPKQCLGNAVGMLPITQDLLPINLLPITKDPLPEKEISGGELLSVEIAFDIFYLAGLVKKSKQSALKSFKAICKKGTLPPEEIANQLADDIKKRIAAKQFGIDQLHPSTYLNGRRWEDEITTSSNQPSNTYQRNGLNQIDRDNTEM